MYQLLDLTSPTVWNSLEEHYPVVAVFLYDLPPFFQIVGYPVLQRYAASRVIPEFPSDPHDVGLLRSHLPGGILQLWLCLFHPREASHGAVQIILQGPSELRKILVFDTELEPRNGGRNLLSVHILTNSKRTVFPTPLRLRTIRLRICPPCVCWNICKNLLASCLFLPDTVVTGPNPAWRVAWLGMSVLCLQPI